MHLEHINLVVSDMAAMLKFYSAAFPHWSIRGEGIQDWYGTSRRWVHFGDNEQYITFNDSGSGDNRNLNSNSVGLAHFAYVTNNINAVIARLSDAGFGVSKVGTDSDFRRNVYYTDPSGFEIEFVEYLSDLPEERNYYE